MFTEVHFFIDLWVHLDLILEGLGVMLDVLGIMWPPFGGMVTILGIYVRIP